MPATIYSDNGSTILANPFTADTDGAYSFYAANARYDVAFAKTNFAFSTKPTYDKVLFDPADFSTVRVTLPAYTKATLPTAGTAGRMARVTDDIRGIWIDTGTEWRSVTGHADVRDWGVKVDGVIVLDAAIGNGTTTLTSATANFTGRSGQTVQIIGAGARTITGGINSGTNTFTSTDYTFTATDVNLQLHIPGAAANGATHQTAISAVAGASCTVVNAAVLTVAGASCQLGSELRTTIASVTNSTTAVLADAATATVTAAEAAIGTDNTATIRSCFDDCRTVAGQTSSGVKIFLPAGGIVVKPDSTPFVMRLDSNMTVFGVGPESIIVRASGPDVSTSEGVSRRVMGYNESIDNAAKQCENVLLHDFTVWGSATGGIFNTYNQQHNITFIGVAAGTILENCDSGWVSLDANVTVTTDSSDFQEGVASTVLTIAAGFTVGRLAEKTLATVSDWSRYDSFQFWLKSDLETLHGDLQLVLYNEFGVAYITRPLNGIAANTWTRIHFHPGIQFHNVAKIELQLNRDQGAQVIKVDGFEGRRSGVRNVVIRDVHSHRSWGTGIYMTGVAFSRITGGTFLDNRRVAIGLTSNLRDIRVEGIYAQTGEGGSSEINCEPNTNGFVDGLYITNCTGGAIKVSSASGTSGPNETTNVFIRGNRCRSIVQLHNVSGFEVNDNLVDTRDINSTAFDVRGGRGVVAHNSVRVTNTTDTSAFSVARGESGCRNLRGDIEVHDNTVINTYTPGTALPSTVRGMGPGQSGLVTPTPKRIHFHHNIIRGFATGMVIVDGEDIWLDSNTVDATTVSISCGAATRPRITNNKNVTAAATLTINSSSVVDPVILDNEATCVPTTNVPFKSFRGPLTQTTGLSYSSDALLTNSATYDPPNTADGAAWTTTVTVRGVAADGTWTCNASHSSLSGAWNVTAFASAADTVTVVGTNHTGGAVDLASGTLRVHARKG